MPDDLEVFRDACQRFGQPLAIRGSTAYTLCKKEDPKSIVGAVPPLGDLDVIVRDTRPADAMQRVGAILEYYRTYVPASRFIHVDVFYEHLPTRGDSPLGNVVVKGLPEVAIGPNGSERRDKLDDVNARLAADVTSQIRATLFRDFLYLLRLRQRHGKLDDAIGEVAALLGKQKPGEIGSATRAEGGARELARIDKALVKHVLLGNLEQEPGRLTDYLAAEWLSRFSTHLNGLSRTIILSEDRWYGTNGIAYAVEGRIREFAEVSSLEGEEKTLLERKMALGTEMERQNAAQRFTPSLMVALPSPPDPECCAYRDFSMGISELAFRDTQGGELVDVALMEGPEKYYPVHAQAAEGFGARSLRSDPGFMAMLNHGSMNAVRILGVRK